MAVLALNKKAFYDYEMLEKYESGLVLHGHEVKSARAGQVNLKGSYVVMKRSRKNLPEVSLLNATISLYKFAGKLENYDPLRSRKLLLKKSEIIALTSKLEQKGLTLVPLKMYTDHGLIKLEIGLGKGKKEFDKRETIKKREGERELRGILRNKR